MSALELALVDLGRHLRYPEADLSTAVVARLSPGTDDGRRAPSHAGAPRRAPSPRRVAVLVAATLTMLVGGLALVSPAVRAALVRVLFVPGIRIVVGEPEPDAPLRLGPQLELGERVSLAEARAEVDFPIRLPSEAGPPDAVFLEPGLADPRVWLVYRERPGLPRTRETGVGLLVLQFAGSVDQDLLKKVQAEGASVRFVEVGDGEGYWIQGAHTLFFLDEDGEIVHDRTRVAGSVLVWEEGGVTYRIESALSLDEVLRLAESL